MNTQKVNVKTTKINGMPYIFIYDLNGNFHHMDFGKSENELLKEYSRHYLIERLNDVLLYQDIERYDDFVTRHDYNNITVKVYRDNDYVKVLTFENGNCISICIE